MTRRSSIDDLNRSFERRRQLLATAPASNGPELATDAASTEDASNQWKTASRVASLLGGGGASNQVELAPKVASNRGAGKRYTPANKTQLNVRVSKHIKAKLDMLSAATGKGINDLIDEAIVLLLATPDASLLATYDSDDDLNDPIIKLVVRYTGRRFSLKDKAAYDEVRHLDRNVIRMGILTTLLNTSDQINGFAYFKPEIMAAAQEIAVLRTPAEYISHLEHRVRQKYRK